MSRWSPASRWAAIIVALIVFLVAFLWNEQPSMGAEKTRYDESSTKCVTQHEWETLPNGSRAEVEQYFETKGYVVYREPTFVLKRYPYCNGTWGWASVSYVKTKTGQFWYYNAVLVFRCADQVGHADGTWDPPTPCGPELNMVETLIM